MPNYFRDEEPTAQEVLDWHKHLSETWSKFREKNAGVEAQLKNDFPIWTDPIDIAERPSYHPGTGRQKVDDAVNVMVAYDPEIDIEPFVGTEGEIHKTRANTKENAARRMWEESGKSGPVHPARQATRSIVARGYSNMGIFWEEPPLKPKKRSGDDKETTIRRERQWEIVQDSWCPLKIKTFNPTSVLIPPFDDPIGIAIQESRLTNMDIANQTERMAEYHEGIDKWEYDGKPMEKLTCYETWTDDHRVMVTADGRMVFSIDNFWGFSPWEHKFSGWGDEFAGEDGTDPAWFAAGLLDTLMETLLWQAKIRSGLNAVMMREAFNKLITKLSKEQLEAMIKGVAFFNTDPKDVQWLTSSQTSSHLSEEANWLDESVERGSIASVLAGMREPGVTTVGQNAQLIYYGGLKWVAPSKALSALASGVTSKMFRMIHLKNEAVKIAGFTIKPEDIDNVYRCAVTFEQADPILRMEKVKLEAALAVQGYSDWWTVHEAAGHKDDTTMLERKVKHEFYFGNPNAMTPYMLDLVEEYADSVGKGDMWRAARAAAAGAAAAGAAPPALPAPPSANPPGGLPKPESATIQAARAGGMPYAG
ncbi:MAG: hypothetical protein ABIH46_12615 [Chloroflexota bacterium]